ncbi:MAG: peptidoglycan DD-metalloendopeptidase family protein [Campylobacterales bacterium]|nr:peptidoglycan DD-metalloendopeptidase family protein [Campylobacterales bacterium]
MKLFAFTLVFFSLSLFAASVDNKISKTNSQLTKYSKNYSNINKKMSQNAKAILKQKKELEEQNELLKKLQEDLALKELSYKDNTGQLDALQKSQKELKERQEKIEEELVFVIAQSVSLSLVLQQDYSANEDSIMEFEVLKQMLADSKKKADELSKQFFANAQDIDMLNQLASNLEVAIANIERKRRDVVKMKEANKQALTKLTAAKKSYKKELKAILKKQDALKQTLAQLNIIKIDEIRKAKEEKARKEAFSKQQFVADEKLPKVKKVGSSYQAVKTLKYTGPKTIAPLDTYSIIKKYGTYTDPIYKIKIFNESISLKPKEKNAKVKTVFNGKVIYADKTAVLDNIVIVEHNNGLHTIYANLSQISPNIQKGKKIKKGYTIGRVEDELVFEVTQKSYHINPIRLFQ